MTILDISGPITDGMWSYGGRYITPRIEQIPPTPGAPYAVFSQVVHMPVQTATYLETAAHLDPSQPTIEQVPLDRCYMLDSLCLWMPRGGGEAISAADLEAACAAAGVQPRPREALLVGTGWDSHWAADDYTSNPPYFLADAIDWVLDHDFSLLGGDTPRYDSLHAPQNFFPKFFSHDILLLAPLVNLQQVRGPRGKLIALPLKIVGACASPVRALWVEE